MTKTKAIITAEELKQALTQDSDFLKPLVQLVLQEVLEAEMEDTLGASKGERVEGRKGYRSGYYTRGLINSRRQARTAGAAGQARPLQYGDL